MENWIKSSKCESNACVEVLRSGSHVVTVRHSENSDAEVSFTAREWAAFTAGVKLGEFD